MAYYPHTLHGAFGNDIYVEESGPMAIDGSASLLTDVQKQIKGECDKLAVCAENWAVGSYAYLFKSTRLNFFASPEIAIRVSLDDALACDEINEDIIAILLILLRATRAPKRHGGIATVCNEIAAMLIEKNRAYGNSALDPIRVFSKASPVEQILVRIDDKLSRLSRGQAAGEDVEKDLIGYLVLLRIARGQNDG
jgi:hypothetical protein